MYRLLTTRALLIVMASLLAVSTLVLGVLLYARLSPLDVLKDWTISVPDQEYAVGEAVTVKSQAVKLVPAEGTATRFLKCSASANDGDREVEIDSLVVNRPVGQRTSTGNDIRVPDVPDLPRRCKLHIAVKYDIYPLLREQFFEYAETGYFTVVAPRSNKETKSADQAVSTPTPTSPVPSAPSSDAQRQAQPEAQAQEPVQQTPQTSDQPAPQPTLIDRLNGLLSGLVGGL